MVGKVTNVEDYVSSLPPDVLPVFEDVRRTIRGVAPEAVEVISYDMPTWTLSGRAFVHVGAWKKHLSLYPAPEMDEELAGALAGNLGGRGTLKFPLAQPLPLDRIEQVVRLLVAERTGDLDE